MITAGRAPIARPVVRRVRGPGSPDTPDSANAGSGVATGYADKPMSLRWPRSSSGYAAIGTHVGCVRSLGNY